MEEETDTESSESLSSTHRIRHKTTKTHISEILHLKYGTLGDIYHITNLNIGLKEKEKPGYFKHVLEKEKN